MPQANTPRGAQCAPARPPRRAPRLASNAGPRVPWPEICVEHLDLDQFDDRGRLIGRRYRPDHASGEVR